MKNDQELTERLNKLKTSVQLLWNKISENDFELTRRKLMQATNTSGNEDTIQHRITPEEAAAAPISAEEAEAIENQETVTTATTGIDSFGEEDTFDPEEADEHQTFRDRKQNSDLNERFPTRGSH